jgi:hypothetical protein
LIRYHGLSSLIRTSKVGNFHSQQTFKMGFRQQVCVDSLAMAG